MAAWRRTILSTATRAAPIRSRPSSGPTRTAKASANPTDQAVLLLTRAIHCPGIRFVGSVADGWDSVVLDGEPESLVFRAFYIKQNRVVAVVTMQRDPESAAAIELFQRKQMPTADAIAANPKLSLSDLVADIHKSATTAKQ